MKHAYKHAFIIVLMGFLLVSPAVAATVFKNSYTPAQDISIDDLLSNIIEHGAELVFANIDEEGAPQVIYGQLGIPSEDLGLTTGGVLSEMYTGCIAMVLVATYGEMLQYIFDLIGFMGTNESDGGIFPLQTDMFSMDSIMDLIGDELNMMINVFIDVEATTSQTRMNMIKNHLSLQFGFGFSELFYLRIDESFFPPDAGIQLPFQSLDVYINQMTISDQEVIDAIFNVMNTGGFADSIDQTKFKNADAAAAGLVAIPDMDALLNLISGFSGSPPASFVVSDFFASQFDIGNLTLEGPLAVAAVGYLGNQLLSTSSTDLDIFADLLGATTDIEPLSQGMSAVIAKFPFNINVTGYSPENQAQNLTFYDNSSNIIFWNATGLGTQPDYSVTFNATNLPPLIALERTFIPDSCAVGESTQVTVTVTNDGDDPIANVSLDDTAFSAIYPDVAVSGSTTGSWPSLAAGASQSITYTVTFTNEGRYTFPGAVVTYTYNTNIFSKDTRNQG
ncbi:MAG: BatD family protein, partial [Candidatus Thorarchaeota archaeon]